MSDWWIVGASFAAAAVLLGYTWWGLRRFRSPSRDAAKAAQGDFEVVRDAMIDSSRHSSWTCPVCHKSRSEVGPMHMYQVDKDMRVCWTP